MTGLRIAEVFGPVWQGEGPATGRVATFLRLGLCNLGCSWCDTPYTWDETRYDLRAEAPEWSLHKAVTALKARPAPLLVVTGGEPTIWMTATHSPLRPVLASWNEEVHVETNGTLIPVQWAWMMVHHWVVSVKVNPQGDPETRRVRPEAVQWYADRAKRGQATFKIVVRNDDEVDAATNFFNEYDIPDDRRWVMPEGTLPELVLQTGRNITERVMHHHLNLTLRQHVLLYGNERRR